MYLLNCEQYALIIRSAQISLFHVEEYIIHTNIWLTEDNESSFHSKHDYYIFEFFRVIECIVGGIKSKRKSSTR